MIYEKGVVSKGDMDVSVACHVDVNWKTVEVRSRGGHYLGAATLCSIL